MDFYIKALALMCHHAVTKDKQSWSPEVGPQHVSQYTHYVSSWSASGQGCVYHTPAFPARSSQQCEEGIQFRQNRPSFGNWGMGWYKLDETPSHNIWPHFFFLFFFKGWTEISRPACRTSPDVESSNQCSPRVPVHTNVCRWWEVSPSFNPLAAVIVFSFALIYIKSNGETVLCKSNENIFTDHLLTRQGSPGSIWTQQASSCPFFSQWSGSRRMVEQAYFEWILIWRAICLGVRTARVP